MKIRTTISIDKNLLKDAKKHNIKISTFLSGKLQECLNNINGVFDTSFYEKDVVALTTRRSHVQFLPGPSTFLKKDEPKNGFNNKGIPILIQ